MREKLRLAAVLVAIILEGCAVRQNVDRLGALAVGDKHSGAVTPPLSGLTLVKWSCVPPENRVDDVTLCPGRDYLIVYRGARHQYNVLVSAGHIARIDRYKLEDWP